mmetsp:Transcript_24407/g.43723  ORF Transcript_24407/g.43723 Transcript_24407/m.43723 type:complete len:713 (-) Transcript_24407:159-2297(-)|eukprot:CAMPEP_0201869556 /NCGR_PEP_ID=MMETSP0902-20130614/3025_1 /ASSEMBLY_ACC=CAM_ASM_000551 /TAXON_ID=420261 /ORGANISM="Thalassiosira antarctica, Strain CCMP982" /LENGTH=712 /DNA_ID=CAMNT_0048395083 /DNA_START=53 /DNA_END=2194 /DNA_ORIENTATION=-
MAKAFGKIKRLIGKNKDKNGDKYNNTSPSSTPTRSTNDVIKPAAVNPVTSTDVTGPWKKSAAAADEERDVVPLLSGSHTGADDVLDGILQDLNIKVGQLAVNAERTDTVSEYSGGSAKSVESSESESSDSDDDEETDKDDDDDDEEEEDGRDKKKRSSTGDRVAAVVAAAEEIRKKRGTTPPLPAIDASRASGSGRTTPATEPGTGRITPATEPPSLKSKEQSMTSKAGSKSNSSKKQASKSSNRRSPVPVKEKSSRSRSTTPQFSPEIKSNNNAELSPGSFGTKDDDCDHTKATIETSEEGEDDRTYEEDGTLGDNTLGSDSMSYEKERGRRVHTRSMSDSQNGDSTFDEEDERKVTKKTVMNKDIIIHQPGGPSSLVVRAMYYTPLPASPDDIIIKVEASTVSFRDCLLRRNIGMDKVSFPFVPGCEVVGIISNIGKAARQEGYRVGDRVVGLTRNGGGNGYYAKLTTKNVAPVTSTAIDPVDVVCLVDVYMTAYQALRVGKKDGTPLTDANVLVTDGFSPIGQAAVMLAKLEGANVYVTTTETRQDEYMKTLGVKCLPLAPSKWLHKLKGKMDIVIDNTCFDSYDSSWKALNSKGVLVCTGMTSIYSFQDFSVGGGGCCDAFGDLRDYQAKWAALKARYMMSQTKFHNLWESFQSNPKKYHQELKYLCFLVESGTLKPKIAERVSIEEIPDAQRYLETGKANGTIVCLP